MNLKQDINIEIEYLWGKKTINALTTPGYIEKHEL